MKALSQSFAFGQACC